MSEQESELAKASAENGNFDSEKAKKAAADAVSQFHAELKKDDRILRIILLICVAGIAYAIENFLFAYSAKAMIGFGILLLFVSEITVVIKLWYWIVNTRITLQKELRQLRVAVLRSPGIAMPGDMELSSPRDWRGISFWEHTAWLLANVIVAFAVAGYVMHRTLFTETISEYVTVRPTGAGSSETQFWQFGGGRSFDFYTSDLKRTFRWLDDHGHEMPMGVSTKDGQRCYTVYPIAVSAAPDTWLQWQRYTQVEENPAAAVKEGDHWTFHEGFTRGDRTIHAFVTVELPRDAKLLSINPGTIGQWSNDGITRVVFDATRKAMEPFDFTIEYQLPNASTQPETTK